MTGVDGQDFARAEVAKGGNWIATVRQDWPAIATTLADIIDAHFAGTDPAESTVFVPGRAHHRRERAVASTRHGVAMIGSPRLPPPARHAAVMVGAALGFDVGTTSVKAGLLRLDEPGPLDVVSRRVRRPQRPRPGWAAAGPGRLARGDGRTAGQTLRRTSPGRSTLRSIGICSQVNTHVFIDEALTPLHPAITWQDTRAAPEAAELDARVADRREALWGGPFTVDASFALSRLAWLATHEPDAWGRARWLLSPKDFCIAAITGSVVTDPISPVGPGRSGWATNRTACSSSCRVRPSSMPPIRALRRSGRRRADRRPLGPAAGRARGRGHDGRLGQRLRLGLVRPGRAMQVAGTSEIVAVALGPDGADAGHHLVPARALGAPPCRADAGRRRRARLGGARAGPHGRRGPGAGRRRRAATPSRSSSCPTSPASARPTGTPTHAACLPRADHATEPRHLAARRPRGRRVRGAPGPARAARRRRAPR